MHPWRVLEKVLLGVPSTWDKYPAPPPSQFWAYKIYQFLLYNFSIIPQYSSIERDARLIKTICGDIKVTPIFSGRKMNWLPYFSTFHVPNCGQLPAYVEQYCVMLRWYPGSYSVFKKLGFSLGLFWGREGCVKKCPTSKHFGTPDSRFWEFSDKSVFFMILALVEWKGRKKKKKESVPVTGPGYKRSRTSLPLRASGPRLTQHLLAKPWQYTKCIKSQRIKTTKSNRKPA